MRNIVYIIFINSTNILTYFTCIVIIRFRCQVCQVCQLPIFYWFNMVDVYYTYTIYLVDMKKVNLYITDKQHKEINRIARSMEIKTSELIRRIFDFYLEKNSNGKKSKEQ